MLGVLSGPELTAYYPLGKQPLEQQHLDQASWKEPGSAVSDHWRRAKKPREVLVVSQGIANAFLPSAPPTCFSGVCYWSPARAHMLPV